MRRLNVRPSPSQHNDFAGSSHSFGIMPEKQGDGIGHGLRKLAFAAIKALFVLGHTVGKTLLLACPYVTFIARECDDLVNAAGFDKSDKRPAT